MTRYIFITGGVVSSLGKGLMAASLAALLQARGFRVRIRKFDPYLNVDPGTMSPYQHGEVYVTDDGAETDLDLGHYERFTGVSARQSDNVTQGRVYQTIIQRERRGDYLGATVQVNPSNFWNNATVIVRDGLIEAVGRDAKIPADARVWPASNTVIYAGFIDPYLSLANTNGAASGTVRVTAKPRTSR